MNPSDTNPSDTNSPDTSERSADERQADEERRRESANRPGGFKNDPDDAANPNEVREHHLKKVKETGVS